MVTHISWMKLSVKNKNDQEEIQAEPSQCDQYTLVYFSITQPHT